MNKQEFDILNTILCNQNAKQREIAMKSGYSIGKVNSAIKLLTDKDYIDGQHELTAKGLEQQEKRKPKNAVILAAGYGIRMVPINMELPKGLLQVRGEALIERLIRQLHEVGVTEIYVVVGFMKEQYEYLIDQYGVELIYNREYSSKNNLHSLLKIESKLGNTYIMPCDIWCEDNPFSKTEWYSWYMVTDEFVEDSMVRINRKKELAALRKEESGNLMIGISYILQEEASFVRKKLRDYSEQKKYNHAFWEECLLDEEKMIVFPKEVSGEIVHEINTYEQLRDLDHHSDHLKSEAIQVITETLGCKSADITNIHALKKGMTNRSFVFEVNQEKYIMRIPGEGTDIIINRRNEYQIYETLKGTGLSDTVLYMSPDNGYKLTKFVNDTHCCDSKDWEEVTKCMQFLKAFHRMNLKVDHTFDLFGQIEYYEQLRDCPSVYRDYNETKEKMYELKQYIDSQPKVMGLAHIDANQDNFLITDDTMLLIDWEYAGMQDLHLDIAMFAIYAMYEKEAVDHLIASYFGEMPEESVKLKIYAYIAVSGFLWSNWCEYKRVLGVEFGEYSIRQYRYAKEYYRYVKKAWNGDGQDENR